MFLIRLYTKKNTQNDDIAGVYLVKKNVLWLPIDDDTDGNNEKDGKDLTEDDLLSYESPAKQTFNHDAKPKQLIKFEYHVLYHMSYAVPYLCFNAHKSSRFLYIKSLNFNRISIDNPTEFNYFFFFFQIKNLVLFCRWITFDAR